LRSPCFKNKTPSKNVSFAPKYEVLVQKGENRLCEIQFALNSSENYKCTYVQRIYTDCDAPQTRRPTKFITIPFSLQSCAEGKPAKGDILLRFETFGEIKLALEEIFSPSAAAVILYESARKCGARSCGRIMKKTRMKEEALRRLSKLKNDENWGKISFRNIDFKKASGRILIEDSFEAVAHSQNSQAANSLGDFWRASFLGYLMENLLLLLRRNALLGAIKIVSSGSLVP